MKLVLALVVVWALPPLLVLLGYVAAKYQLPSVEWLVRGGCSWTVVYLFFLFLMCLDHPMVDHSEVNQ